MTEDKGLRYVDIPCDLMVNYLKSSVIISAEFTATKILKWVVLYLVQFSKVIIACKIGGQTS